MKLFEPDYRNIELSARNTEAPRLPLYEHIISDRIMEKITNRSFVELYNGSYSDKLEYFKHYCDFFKRMGYDTVSFEQCIGGAMPGSGALGGHVDPVIKDRADFDRYPWDTVLDRYFDLYSESFKALREVMPAGMKAIGGVGNGIFECAQELTGFTGLCYISADDPDLYADLFHKIGEVSQAIWKRFMEEFGDIYCVLRFGDDLGYKSNVMLSSEDVISHIIPEYRKIIETVHQHKKPFLLHSCGCIFSVMEELINIAGIDAKHSNEDQIARFPEWVERYGDRIGNFGGIDTDAVCRLTKPEMREYISDVVKQCKGHGGFAFGSGNSIPDYVPVEGFICMTETIRELRGE